MTDKPAGPPPTLSLYDDLLSSNPGASISSAPVLRKSEDDDVKSKLAKIQQTLNAARPQPKRPAQNAAKAGFRPKIPSSTSKTPSSSSVVARTSSPLKKDEPSGSSTPGISSSVQIKSGIDDWVGDDEWYEGPKRERGNRKKRKKKEKERREREEQNWDAVYDPTRPTSYEAYKDSAERLRELEDWMATLRGNRRRRDSTMRSSRSSSEGYARPTNRMFAPPGMGFAPPASYDDMISTDSPTRPPALPTDDATGEDAYSRRMRLSGMAGPPQSPSPPPSFVQTSPMDIARSEAGHASPPPPPPTFAIPQLPPGAVLSAEPVRYTLPPPPPDLPTNDEELAEAMEPEPEVEPVRSSRPGQKGFAERYMAKHGYKKGQGLGASGTGILSALAVKVEKQRPDQARKPQYDEDGVLIPGTGAPKPSMGKIVGGKKKKGTEDAKMSSVVRCLHMVDGRDLDYEMGPDGNLVEEIGKGCTERYGNIERVFIWRSGSVDDSVPVFLKFTAQISALRAIAALDGGQFAGNTVKAEFWDEDKFENGVYE